MSERHILFVETHGKMLQGLMRTLSSVDDDWKIVLSTDADAALEMLSQRRFSILVGGFGDNFSECENFLGKVQQSAPAVIRFALLSQPGGHCASSPEYAHQCFSDKCPADEIAAAIQRGLTVWDRCTKNPALTDLLAHIHNIPTPPTLYFEIREEMNSANCDARSISKTLAHDPALCAKLLKVANSGFYAMPRTVSDVHEAVTFLGTDTIASLVLATHVFSRMPVPGLNLDALWKHSLTSSALCREIVMQQGGDRLTINTAGVAGLLHDIGQLIFLSNMPDRFHPMLRSSDGDEEKLLQMEQETFGVGHPELSSYLLALWSLPEAVVRAVASHHDVAGCSSEPRCLITNAVFMAEWFLQKYSVLEQPSEEGREQEYPPECLNGQIDDWREMCEQLLSKSI